MRILLTNAVQSIRALKRFGVAVCFFEDTFSEHSISQWIAFPRYSDNKCNKFSFFFIYILQHRFCIWPNPLHHPSSARTISFSSARISAVRECSPSNYYKQGTIAMPHGCFFAPIFPFAPIEHSYWNPRSPEAV